MATLGLVTVMSEKKVVMKIIAGSDGYFAPQLANKLKNSWPVDIKTAYEMARKIGFGGIEDLVVITESEVYFKGDEDISPLYRETFTQMKFNPRWEIGEAENTIVIKV